MAETERPAIVLVDDDRSVLRAVERDVRQRYARDYRILAVTSGGEALDALGRLALRGDQAALIVADQRMPGMTGTELLTAATEHSRNARRVLLTAYADTDAAIDAINRADVDYYILKPWDPPEEKLYPILDDLLEEWQATARRTRGGVRVVGDRWSAESHRLRDFLSRNQIPFRWLDVALSAEAPALLASARDARLPMVVLEDGTILNQPEPSAVAAALGMPGAPQSEFFDLVVVGAGPAGLAAAVYGASEGLSTAVLESDAPGGQAGTSSLIENYLGFPQGVSGAELARRALTQARRFGASVIAPRRAARLRRADPYRVVELNDGTCVHSTAVIVATGVHYQSLDAPGADRLTGCGVYYGSAASEAAHIAGEHVVVVGGANSAGQAAVYLARFADHVTMAVRADSLELRMSTYLIEQVRSTPNISVRVRTRVGAVHGEERLERITLVGDDGEETIEAGAAFVFIGAQPRTDWIDGMVIRDDRGFIRTGPALSVSGLWSLDRDPYLLETSIPGVFAVGDVRSESVKRVASAVGEGAVAIQLVHAYLQG